MKEPRQLGRYYLTERIAKGGMAEVYHAKSVGAMGFMKDVAIKLMRESSDEVDFVGMFMDEAQIAGALEHPNIVKVHDLGVEAGEYFMAMEFVAGQNLRSVLCESVRQKQPISCQMAAYIVAQVCAGLGYAHQKKDLFGRALNIIHRDISPPNVLISYEGEVKLIDFGIAKAEDNTHHTELGTLKGKYGYMSPEQAQGRAVDLRSDLFSLGIVLYELLTGQGLFRSPSVYKTIQNVSQMPIAAPSQLRPEVPEILDRIALRALTREVGLRYASAEEMRLELEHFLYSHPPFFSPRSLMAHMESLFCQKMHEEQAQREAYAPFFASMLEARGRERRAQQSQAPPGSWFAPLGEPSPGGRLCAVTYPRPTDEVPSYSGPFPQPLGQGSFSGPHPDPRLAEEPRLAGGLRQVDPSAATSYSGPHPMADPRDGIEALGEDDEITSYIGPRPGPSLASQPTAGSLSQDAWAASDWELDAGETRTLAMPTVLADEERARRLAVKKKLLVGLLVGLLLGAVALGLVAAFSQSPDESCQRSVQIQLTQAPERIRVWVSREAVRASQLHRRSARLWTLRLPSCRPVWVRVQADRRAPVDRFINPRSRPSPLVVASPQP